MRLRIRLGEGRPFHRKPGKNRHIAGAVSALLTPASVVAATLAVWGVAADIGLTSQFAITKGFFSHWQVWAGTAVLIHGFSWLLDDYVRRHEAPPRGPVSLTDSRKPAKPLE